MKGKQLRFNNGLQYKLKKSINTSTSFIIYNSLCIYIYPTSHPEQHLRVEKMKRTRENFNTTLKIRTSQASHRQPSTPRNTTHTNLQNLNVKHEFPRPRIPEAAPRGPSPSAGSVERRGGEAKPKQGRLACGSN